MILWKMEHCQISLLKLQGHVHQNTSQKLVTDSCLTSKYLISLQLSKCIGDASIYPEMLFQLDDNGNEQRGWSSIMLPVRHQKQTLKW